MTEQHRLDRIALLSRTTKRTIFATQDAVRDMKKINNIAEGRDEDHGLHDGELEREFNAARSGG